MRRQATLATFLGVTGLILLPVAIFLFGWLLAGRYDGPGGIFGFLGSLYGDLLRGRPLAWSIVLAPACLIGLWWLVGRFVLARRPAVKAVEPGE